MARGGEQQRRGRHAPDDDAAGVRVFQRAQQVARQRMHRRDEPGTAARGVVQALALDPVAHAEGKIADYAGVVDVADGRVIQPAQCFGFSKEPAAERVIRIEMNAETDLALQRLVVGGEQHPLPRGRHHVLEAVAVSQRFVGPEKGLRAVDGHRSRPRRRSTRAVRPQTSGLQQRRPCATESSVKNSEQSAPAH